MQGSPQVVKLEGREPNRQTAELEPGVFPPFNSLDVDNGLPLGSATIEDLSALSFDVTGLEQGVPYYFRVFAVNKLGQGGILQFRDLLAYRLLGPSSLLALRGQVLLDRQTRQPTLQ